GCHGEHVDQGGERGVLLDHGHRKKPFRCQEPYISSLACCKVPVMSRPQTERGAGYLVKRVQQALRRRCDAVLKPTGLSMAQYALLRALHDHPDASASELARLCFVTRQSLRDVLGGLRTAGLVALADAQGRGRARALQLTPLGLRCLKDSHAAVED